MRFKFGQKTNMLYVIISIKKKRLVNCVLKPIIKADGETCSPDGTVRELKNLGVETMLYRGIGTKTPVFTPSIFK